MDISPRLVESNILNNMTEENKYNYILEHIKKFLFIYMLGLFILFLIYNYNWSETIKIKKKTIYHQKPKEKDIFVFTDELTNPVQIKEKDIIIEEINDNDNDNDYDYTEDDNDITEEYDAFKFAEYVSEKNTHNPNKYKSTIRPNYEHFKNGMMMNYDNYFSLNYSNGNNQFSYIK